MNTNKPTNVLIVDDSPTECYIIKQILEKEGYHVEYASNGEEGIAKATKLMPDIILIDMDMNRFLRSMLYMPIMNGYQMIRKLKEKKETCGIPLIKITTIEAIEESKSWGHYEQWPYLTKPIDPQKLKKILLDFCNEH